MDEENFDYEELREFVKQEMEKTYTVEEALKEREEEEKLINDSFDALWQNYHAVEEIRHEALKNLRGVKYRVILSNLLWLLIRYDVKEEVELVIELMNRATNEIKDQKDMLNAINVSIQKLQAHMTYNCNYELAKLLSYIYDKNVMIYDSVCTEMSATASRISGFSTQTPDYESKKQSLDDKIDESMLKLGLKK